ncbi:MAG TPA: DUF371 domain-containing protein [Candidatus Glassbacteria bacterium]|nr:DUF371 domain-containing protein [Candidatus Glassbacteria bacterium]
MKTTNNQEVIHAYGHKNILATHKTTIEFTKDKHLTKNGTCIIAVAANKSLAELNDNFKKNLKKDGSKLTIIIEVNGLSNKIMADCFPEVLFTNTKDMVIRKSEYISDRTLAIRANKAACDLDSHLVDKLKNPKERVKITLIIN